MAGSMTSTIHAPIPTRCSRRCSEDEQARGRGRLNIFFGACAGVGKTYAMLGGRAQAARRGVDVVVGVSRPTAAARPQPCSQGLRAAAAGAESSTAARTLPSSTSMPRWRASPACMLVDELAHTNVAGLAPPQALAGRGGTAGRRHRRLDSTLNVQHLESLNDVVGGITGIRVHETVPDTVLRPRRRGRAGRRPARRTDRAARGRQGLPAGSRPSARRRTSSARAT